MIVWIVANLNLPATENTIRVFSNESDAFEWNRRAQSNSWYVFKKKMDVEGDLKFLHNPTSTWIVHSHSSAYDDDDNISYAANPLREESIHFYQNPEAWENGVIPNHTTPAQDKLDFSGTMNRFYILVDAETEQEALEKGKTFLEMPAKEAHAAQLWNMADKFLERWLDFEIV